MKKKKNGFTFVELLAMLVILGLIMIIAVPNITGMLKQQKFNQFKSDATRMVESAKVKVGKDRVLVKPKSGECIVFALNYLDDNESIVTGPNGGEYDQFDSFVVYTRDGSKYKYYFRLVENYKNKKIGISLNDSSSIKELLSTSIVEVNNDTGLEKDDTRTQGINKLKSFQELSNVCTTIKGYYSGGNYCIEYNGIYYDNEGNRVSQDKFSELCN